MFAKAIEIAAKFTRPIHTITRNFGFNAVVPGAATLILVNADGWALTCGHVAKILLIAEQVNSQYENFKIERSKIIPGKKARNQLNQLERTFGYARDATIQIENTFVSCVDAMSDCEIRSHPSQDIALIKFNDFTKVECDVFPVFAVDGSELKQGKSICRLGFPFPEFCNFEYDVASDSIRWNNDPRNATPQFPIDGMVTRHLLDGNDVVGFELSTPGLKGQSGGPAFDVEGRVWGIQSSTNHLDLDFDIDMQVVRGHVKKPVKDHAFLHVGHCIDVEVLKGFMRSNGVDFIEG